MSGPVTTDQERLETTGADAATPLVSVVVPTHNNEGTILRTLDSLLEQTLREIEIVIVDDASADGTVELCKDAARQDPRIIVISLDENQTALQTRRIGVERASGTYVMFCDADDELEPHAAETASSFAMEGGYDVVHFGTSIISTTGSKHPAWERALDPFGTELFGDETLAASAFGRPANPINGHLWNKLYARVLVERAWQPIDPELRLPRAQDVYQSLLILSNAERYGGLASQLYRYHYGAGKSGNVADRETFQHFLAAGRTYRAVVDYLESDHWDPSGLIDAGALLARLRRQLIGNCVDYWFRLPRPANESLADLLQQWDAAEVVGVMAERHPNRAGIVIDALSRSDSGAGSRASRLRGPQRIALLGNINGIGGVQKVLAMQADILSRAGHAVTILTFDSPDEIAHELPQDVEIRTIGPARDASTSAAGLIRALRDLEISLLLNHDNYSQLFPWTAVTSRILGVSSALFLHNFALRALLDFRPQFAYLPEIALGYDTTVTLSAADRQWWEASGVKRVRTLTNFGFEHHDGLTQSAPLESTETILDESTPRPVDLLWVGRLHDETKNVSGLLKAFAELIGKRPETTLAIVGGEQNPGESAALEQLAERLGVREQVLFVGPTNDTAAWYRSASVFVATANIEGFMLTLIEAQSFGLPVVMYDLPYLETVAGNPGVVAVEWGNGAELAAAVRTMLDEPGNAGRLGAAGRAWAERFSVAEYERGLRSIVSELAGEQADEDVDAADPGSLDTVEVPRAVLSELYRLYGHMQQRVTGELRSARRDTARINERLADVKRTLSDTHAHQHDVASAFEQIEAEALVSDPSESSRPKSRKARAKAAVADAAYSVYRRANRRTAAELRGAETDTAQARKDLDELKRMIADTEAQQRRLTTLVSRLEKSADHAPVTGQPTSVAAVSSSPVGVRGKLTHGMRRRADAELSDKIIEARDARSVISRLTLTLAESDARQQQLNSVLRQIKTVEAAPQPMARPALGAAAPGEVWPLWFRQGPQSVTAPATAPFDDVQVAHSSAPIAAWALETGLLGEQPARFDGDSPVSRYDFIQMLYRLAGSPAAPLETSPYGDLDVADPAVAWALRRNIISTPARTEGPYVPPSWNPDNALLRRSAAMLLYRAAGQPRYRSPEVSPFADLVPGQDLFKEMSWTAHQSILPGLRHSDGTLRFDEKHRMTRLDAVSALFHQLLGPIAAVEATL